MDSSTGTVIGAPLRWLRIEGATLLAGSLIAFPAAHQSWWLVPLTLLVPDTSMLAYLGGKGLGARIYNLVHVTPPGAVLIGIGTWRDDRLVVALGLIWLAHIGIDRLLGYGLKYEDDFQHTHLSTPRRKG
jgi:hypothetical protein